MAPTRLLRLMSAACILLMLLSCAPSGDFDRAEAERVLGAVEVPLGAFTVSLFAHFEGIAPTGATLAIDTEGTFSGEEKGPQGGDAQASGKASLEPAIELTPAQLDASFSLALNGYAVTGLVLDGVLSVTYAGDRQTFTRTITGDLSVGGDLTGSISIDLTLTDLGRRREWTGSLGQHVYDARTSY